MKTSIKSLRAKCDKLFSQVCFKMWGNRCMICGGEATATHHFIPKSISAYLRYEPLNGVPLCYPCHIVKIHTQGNPLALEAIIKAHKDGWYEDLKAKKREGEKKVSFMGVKYLKEKIKEFNNYLNQ